MEVYSLPGFILCGQYRFPTEIRWPNPVAAPVFCLIKIGISATNPVIETAINLVIGDTETNGQFSPL